MVGKEELLIISSQCLGVFSGTSLFQWQKGTQNAWRQQRNKPPTISRKAAYFSEG